MSVPIDELNKKMLAAGTAIYEVERQFPPDSVERSELYRARLYFNETCNRVLNASKKK